MQKTEHQMRNMKQVCLTKYYNAMAIAMTVLLLSSSMAFAQSLPGDRGTQDAISQMVNDVQKEAQAREEQTDEVDIKPFEDSLFFTETQVSAIRRAMGGLVTRLNEIQDNDGDGESDVPPPPRILNLAGMLYKEANDWIIWLNGFRVTPERLLPEIVDISVGQSHVDLKWFDAPSNKIISIKLRPHQTYDIETGILLPG